MSMSIRLACYTFSISGCCYSYRSKLGSENPIIANWLMRLTRNHGNWGFGLYYLYLQNVKGYLRSYKRVYRIYMALDGARVELAHQPRNRIMRQKRLALVVPERISQCSSVDSMHDQLSGCCSCRLINAIYHLNSEGLAIEVDLSFQAIRVTRVLDNIIKWRGKPEAIRYDSGPEHVSEVLTE